ALDLRAGKDFFLTVDQELGDLAVPDGPVRAGVDAVVVESHAPDSHGRARETIMSTSHGRRRAIAVRHGAPALPGRFVPTWRRRVCAGVVLGDLTRRFVPAPISFLGSRHGLSPAAPDRYASNSHGWRRSASRHAHRPSQP